MAKLYPRACEKWRSDDKKESKYPRYCPYRGPWGHVIAIQAQQTRTGCSIVRTRKRVQEGRAVVAPGSDAVGRSRIGIAPAVVAAKLGGGCRTAGRHREAVVSRSPLMMRVRGRGQGIGISGHP